MHRTLRSLSIMGFVAILAGCATMTIEGDGQKTSASITGTHTLHGSFYGFLWSEPLVEKCENGKDSYRARYHTNMLYAMASVGSLGLYVPQTVEWWCDSEPNSTLEEGVYQPTYIEEETKPGYSF